jgi:hypothetical protein
MSTTVRVPLVRELDRRVDGGADVQLLWHADEDRVTVAVDDATTGDVFSLDIREGERALDVFRFPFAYATLRGVDTSGVAAAPVLSALCARRPA